MKFFLLIVAALTLQNNAAEPAMPPRGLCAHRGAMSSHPENTIPAFQEAVRLDPNNPQSLLGLSEALAERGAFDLAIEMLDRVVRLPLVDAMAAEVRAKRELYVRSKP